MIRPATAIACFLIAGSSLFTPARADIVLPGVGVTVTENFNSFQGDGFSPTPAAGQLDSNTYRAIGFSDGPGTFGGTHDSGDFARGVSTGGVTTGGAYAFEITTGDFAVGVQPTGADFTPGTFTMRILNDTGTSISGFHIDADALVFNDADRSTTWSFEFSLNDIDYFQFASYESAELADGSPVWELTPLGGNVSFGTSLADGGQFYFQVRGDDLAGSGSRDEFAIDNIALTAIPEPSGGLLVAVVGILFCFLGRQRIARCFACA